MKTADKAFPFFYDWVSEMKELEGELFKKIVLALSNYHRTKDKELLNGFTGVERAYISNMLNQFDRLEAKREAGRKGGQRSLENRLGALGMLEATSKQPRTTNTNTNTDTNTDTNSLLSEKKEKTSKELENQFNEFWSVYPKKASKPYAKKIYLKIAPSADLHVIMLNAIKVQKQSKQWKDAQYIPNPSTWLNQEKWNDETTPIDNKYARLETPGNELLEIIKTIK